LVITYHGFFHATALQNTGVSRIKREFTAPWLGALKVRPSSVGLSARTSAPHVTHDHIRNQLSVLGEVNV